MALYFQRAALCSMDPYSYSMGYSTGYQGGHITATHNKKIQNYVFNMNDVLGKGNFSKVYRAVNELTNQVVAIKVVELSSIKTPALVQLLYSEIDILKTLKHPNVLNCLEVFTSTNNCYIITELCDGGDVESKIRAKGPLDEKDARKLIYEVYQGIKYLAEQNIVHRDIKIANIFLKNGIAKIADFGFARRTTEQWKDINIGSPIYMSPEGLIENVYGPKTDVWAFGIFMYQILHGDTPLGFCKTESQLKFHIITPLPYDRIKSSLPHDLKDLVLRCLDIEERRRISARDIENHPYMQMVYREMGRKTNEFTSSMYMHQLEESKSRENFYGSQESTNVSIKIIQPTSLLNPSMPSNISPHRNYQKLLSIPGQREQTGRSLSPANPSNGVGSYNLDQRKNTSGNGYYGNESMKRGLSMQKSAHNTSNWQSMQLNTPTNNNPSKIALPDAMVSSKHLQPKKLSPSKRIPGKLITTSISFQQCVQLLHYCRLVYKSIVIMNKSLKGMNLKIMDTYTNWLLDMLDQINDKIPNFVRFEGEKAAMREKKLRQVIGEYYTKYNKELKRKLSLDVTLQSVQNITIKSLFYLQSQISNDSTQDKKQMIKLSHYLYFMTELNRILQVCMDTGDYTAMIKNCNIENFLNNRKEAYDMNSYSQLKPKLFRLAQ